ncbi:COX15/CtaA family protein [Aliifodinibius sp. S!AR15-10]|uniref:COX15/CtaA family protein n=1 Tax=Aliifodinibius sp. S!AR15-10 TaxID=2950437 RepID=UPI002866042C|nr:COX15/CtaA family protein [Aliifodinibius sp. S!AR15-10]MDR8390753.1 COX15/CtaA family protein [Aliifodinibius sp. S!AR15-10]
MTSHQRKWIRRWLWTGALLIFVMVLVGGITRLTDSGLSMSDWSLIMGAIPPINKAEWMTAFECYKEFPQYQQINAGMSLAEFKAIFFWEYLHRLLGRVIGLVFLIPFGYFWIRRYFNSKMLKRAWILFGLGALQGGMGWFMVKSGLVDLPYVSHYRLAMHLVLAMILMGFCAWYALDLNAGSPRKEFPQAAALKRWSYSFVIIFAIQVIWGAFTAGLDAGYIYNTFPAMNGAWLPRNAWTLDPALVNLVENPGTVQWVHRILATALGLIAMGFWWKNYKTDVIGQLTRKAGWLLAVVLLQYLLGIVTILSHVHIVMGVAHQAGALTVLFLWVLYHHELMQVGSTYKKAEPVSKRPGFKTRQPV